MSEHAFRYWNAPDSYEVRTYSYLAVSASKIATIGMSFWNYETFVDGFVHWMDQNIKEDCFYATSEDYRQPLDYRFLFFFYFHSERDATLFKLFWC